MTLTLGTIQLILEGIGTMLAVVGLGSSLGVTAAVLIHKPSEAISHWGHVGTALGFLIGIPAGILAVLLLSN